MVNFRLFAIAEWRFGDADWNIRVQRDGDVEGFALIGCRRAEGCDYKRRFEG